ncbi:MAG: histidine phosphatase family protein [Pleurocapsa minor GSE-CHR-MK-17-07R]|nr:histidine phosphatase family protein [Pleurocapsa minor GSE-CHR-MK 17-07R]
MVKRVMFIRPGETEWNRQGRWQGWVASPLSEQGKKQAAALAKYIRHLDLSVLYTSTLRRALQTVDALRPGLTCDVVEDYRLNERGVGLWQGLTIHEMREWYPEDYARLLADSENFRIPEGESRADVRKRITAAFNAYLAEDRGEMIGILSHTVAIKLLLESLIHGVDAEKIGIGNMSVTTIRRTEEGWQLLVANDVAHLEGLESNAVKEPEERQ